jgi:sorbitol-specific phosphotransferase system component IIBC
MHLPVMTESYLRKDFHFAMYLGYCYGKVLTKFFKWSLQTVLILFGIVVLVNVFFTITADDMIDQLLRFIAFLTAFITLIMVKSCVKSAEKQLVPSVFEKEEEL